MGIACRLAWMGAMARIEDGLPWGGWSICCRCVFRREWRGLLGAADVNVCSDPMNDI